MHSIAPSTADAQKKTVKEKKTESYRQDPSVKGNVRQALSLSVLLVTSKKKNASMLCGLYVSKVAERWRTMR